MTRSMPPSSAAATALVAPPVGRPRKLRLPNVADHTLANGLRVIVARRPAIPRFEAHLVIPGARLLSPRDVPRLRVLSATVLSGTSARTSRQIAEILQGMGAAMGAHVDADDLTISGSCLSSYRRQFLDLLGEVVRDAAYPNDEVALERERTVQEIALQRSQAATVAAEALARRMWGRHPYGFGTPDPETIAGVAAPALRRLHRERVVPAEGVLVLVGDLAPAATIADAEAAFAGWDTGEPLAEVAAPSFTPKPLLLLDRPGAVQTTVRIGGPALPRQDPRWPALAVATTILAGSFTSRLNDNIREDKGYTYGAHGRVEHRRLGSQLTLSTDVGREVTAAALVEINRELGRLVALPVEQAELDDARRYIEGSLAMAIQTQAGLAGSLASFAVSGLSVEYLAEYGKALREVRPADVQEAASRHLAPLGLSTVLVGDAAVVGPSLTPLVGEVATTRE